MYGKESIMMSQEGTAATHTSEPTLKTEHSRCGHISQLSVAVTK
jgi:hypothetical protein